MAILTVRNVPDEVHRALRVRSTEAEVRAILAETVLREGRVGLGSPLADVGRRARLTAPDDRSVELSQPAATSQVRCHHP